MIRPIHSNILGIPDKDAEATKSGIYVSASVRQPKVRVVAVGPLVETVKEGDYVLAKDADLFTFEGQEYVSFDEMNILAIL